MASSVCFHNVVVVVVVTVNELYLNNYLLPISLELVPLKSQG